MVGQKKTRDKTWRVATGTWGILGSNQLHLGKLDKSLDLDGSAFLSQKLPALLGRTSYPCRKKGGSWRFSRPPVWTLPDAAESLRDLHGHMLLREELSGATHG